MRKVLVLVLLLLAAASLSYAAPSKGQPSQAIMIIGNGVSPPIDTIQKIGDTYTLTEDLTSPLIIQNNNIIFEGANHTILGSDQNGIGVNITASNVTIENLQITNWGVGILSAWNGNNIKNNQFINDSRAISLYSDDNLVIQNNIENCQMGIFVDGGNRPQGDNNLITENRIVGSHMAFDTYSTNGVVVTKNDIDSNEIVLDFGAYVSNVLLYCNNFVNNSEILEIPGLLLPGDIPVVSPAGQWDNGSVGNYWSDYVTKYPAATISNQTRIGGTPYLIEAKVPYSTNENGWLSSGTVVTGRGWDNFPLTSPITIAANIGPVSAAAKKIPELPVYLVLIVLLAVGCLAALPAIKRQLKR